MKKQVILLVSLLVSLLAAPVVPAYNGFPLSSTPLRPADEGSDPFGPAVPPPVISGDPISGPSGGRITFTNPVTHVVLNAWISLQCGYVDICFDKAVNVSSVSIRNLTTGAGYAEYYYHGGPFSSVGFPMPTSNGTWEVCIQLLNGGQFYGKFVVNSLANGPQVPIDWFCDEYIGL